MVSLDQHHDHEPHCHNEHECCSHETSLAETELNSSTAGRMQTTLQVAGVDCAEEVSAIRRALKPLIGVRDVRVNVMSGKAIIAHDESVTPAVLIKAIDATGLKATREGEKVTDDAQQRQKQRLVSVCVSGAFTLFGLLIQGTHFAPKPVSPYLFPGGDRFRRLVHRAKGACGHATLCAGYEPADDHRCARSSGYR